MLNQQNEREVHYVDDTFTFLSFIQSGVHLIYSKVCAQLDSNPSYSDSASLDNLVR